MFAAIENKCLILMTDPYANYVIQKILDIGKNIILLNLKNRKLSN